MALEDRHTKVANLYCEGRCQWQIAAFLGLSQSTVSRDLAAVRQERKEARIGVVETCLQEELAKIDHLEKIAWEAWYRSCKDAFSRKTRTVEGADKRISEVIRRSQCGNPAFLERVAWCINRRCELLGLDPSKTIHLSGAVQVDELTDEEREAALARILAELRLETGHAPFAESSVSSTPQPSPAEPDSSVEPLFPTALSPLEIPNP